MCRWRARYVHARHSNRNRCLRHGIREIVALENSLSCFDQRTCVPAGDLRGGGEHNLSQTIYYVGLQISNQMQHDVASLAGFRTSRSSDDKRRISFSLV